MADAKEEKKAKKPNTKGKKEAAEDEDDDDDDRKGSGAIVALVAVLIILIWLVIFAILIKMDVGGFGSTVMYPILKDVPYLNKILPDTSSSNDTSAEDSQYQFATMDDAVARIKELEQQLSDAQNQQATDQATLANYQAEEQELQQYKDNEAQFEAEKAAWYQDIVYNNNAPDISEYKKYYEEIDPSNAETLYKQVVQQEETQSQIDDYVKTYSSMKPAQAAAIFDTMTDNLSLVAKILNNMDAESRGNILGAMDATTAAQVTEIMNPQ